MMMCFEKQALKGHPQVIQDVDEFASSGRIYFLTCKNFGRKFQTQCVETFIH